MPSPLTLGDVLAQIPANCGQTRAFLAALSDSASTPVKAVLSAEKLARLPVGVNRARLSAAIAEAYLMQ